MNVNIFGTEINLPLNAIFPWTRYRMTREWNSSNESLWKVCEVVGDRDEDRMVKASLS